MSLIIWAATHEGLLVASDQQDPPRIFLKGNVLLSVVGDPGYAAALGDHLEKHQIDLTAEVHVEALRTVVCDLLPPDSEATVCFGQHHGQHYPGLSGMVFMTARNGRIEGFEIREYADASETEYIPLGAESQRFLETVAPHPAYIKTLRQKKIKYVKDLTLDVARKIAREMIRDTYLSRNRKPPEVDTLYLS